MVDTIELKSFLLASNEAGYAGDKAPAKTEEDKSTTIIFEKGDWKSEDNYFGGEPYGGRVIVFYKNLPVWIMVYYGWVESSVTDFGQVYGFLKKALLNMPPDNPYRGPKELIEGEYSYFNSWNGEIDRFSGEEIIQKGGKEIYRAKYLGGLVDLKR